MWIRLVQNHNYIGLGATCGFVVNRLLVLYGRIYCPSGGALHLFACIVWSVCDRDLPDECQCDSCPIGRSDADCGRNSSLSVFGTGCICVINYVMTGLREMLSEPQLFECPYLLRVSSFVIMYVLVFCFCENGQFGVSWNSNRTILLY